MTGPTGSGKTTTLYGALDKINSPDKKIITVEDPIEYQIKGVNQIQVKPRSGSISPSTLRHIVRQDPDIIMIGEIRDLETAEIAIQSALTGHLVFSTLHTNDAPSAITRLLDMGVEAFSFRRPCGASSPSGSCGSSAPNAVEPTALMGDVRGADARSAPTRDITAARGYSSCSSSTRRYER